MSVESLAHLSQGTLPAVGVPGFFPLFIAYLLGTIPFGLILTKVFLKVDIRSTGSGNIGATNVLRTGNKSLALATLLSDGLKGVAAILLFFAIQPQIFSFSYSVSASLIGFFAILGHCFPVWLKFKGGKGVATTLGVLLAAVPYAGLSSCATWLLLALVFKYSSLAALVAAAVAPIVALFVYGPLAAGVCALIALLVWGRHKENIKRLLKGDEPKIGAKKAAPAPAANAEPPSGM